MSTHADVDANLDVVDIGADVKNVFLGSPDRKIGLILVLMSKMSF